MCGALMACATPPMNVYPMAWLGLVGFFLLLGAAAPSPAPSALREAAHAGALGLVFGIGTNLVALRFVSQVVTRFASVPAFVGPVALIVLAAFEGLRLASAAVVYKLLARLGVPRVLAFAIGIYAGAFLPTMIPWTVACGVCPWPVTVQLAELVGERGVAFLMALESACVAVAVERVLRPGGAGARRPLAVAGALLAATLLYGAVRIGQIDALRAASPRASVALAVAGVDATERWEKAKARSIVLRLTDLTVDAERDGADLVIWPEAAYPYSMAHVSRHAPGGEDAIVQPGVRGPILTGLIMTGSRGRYNSAAVATSDGMISEPYDKMHLMWFGEMVPFEDELPWLREAFARGVGLRAGERQVGIDATPSIRLAVLNCLEDILPAAGREAMTVAPNLLVNLTNDAWFGGTAESEYHLLLSRLRSVEHRRDLVRAVNFGPTTWVDAAGRVLARMPGDVPGVLMTSPALIDGVLTPYSRWGEWPLSLLVAASALVARAITAQSRKG